MSYLDLLLKHCSEKEIGTIDIRSAILWKSIDYGAGANEPPSKDLFVFDIKSEKTATFLEFIAQAIQLRAPATRHGKAAAKICF